MKWSVVETRRISFLTSVVCFVFKIILASTTISAFLSSSSFLICSGMLFSGPWRPHGMEMLCMIINKWWRHTDPHYSSTILLRLITSFCRRCRHDHNHDQGRRRHHHHYRRQHHHRYHRRRLVVTSHHIPSTRYFPTSFHSSFFVFDSTAPLFLGFHPIIVVRGKKFKKWKGGSIAPKTQRLNNWNIQVHVFSIITCTQAA